VPRAPSISPFLFHHAKFLLNTTSHEPLQYAFISSFLSVPPTPFVSTLSLCESYGVHSGTEEQNTRQRHVAEQNMPPRRIPERSVTLRHIPEQNMMLHHIPEEGSVPVCLPRRTECDAPSHSIITECDAPSLPRIMQCSHQRYALPSV
jgi:hypothetical protein